MDTPSIYTTVSERQTRHFLVSCVCADSPDGENAVAFWAKNWSRRRLRVVTKQTARRLGVALHMAVFVPCAGELNHRNFPWYEASIFRVVP